jgi:superoxide dismutase, Fe-Mn family
MSSLIMNRRAMIGATVATAAALPAIAQAQVTTAAKPPALPGYAVKPLPFDPKSIPGLSEKLLTSHHDINYGSTVKKLASIASEYAKLDLATAPGFLINGLKREELIAQNSMFLHELYFSNLGTPNQPGAKLGAAIERSFGSMADWRTEFAAMGKALGGGSGWVVLNRMEDGRLINQWASDHAMSFAAGTPLLAMDMYEHAYAIDYGAKVATYVDACMAALNWTVADARFAKLGG